MNQKMGYLKIVKRFLKYSTIAIISILMVLFIIYFGPSIWKNWVTYPRLNKERNELWTKYKKPAQFIPMQSYKGVMHSHTYWSHDSRGVLPEILDAAKKAELEFIFLADHAHGKLDTFPRSYHGIFDGIILEAGTESSTGLMVNPFDSVILDWNKDEDQLIKEVIENGGLVTYVHTEKEHRWTNPDYQAMEIYNIHTDLLDEDGILPFVISNTVNGNTYRDWCFRELFDVQTDILANWDALNLNRRIVGISAVDAHNNNNFRARYTDSGLVEWTGPNADIIADREANWLDKILLGEPDKFGWAFKWEMDPYFNSFNFVNNHVVCDTFSNVSIKENIIKGHVFFSFESLAKADGFQYVAVDETNTISAILGDAVSIDNVAKIKAVSPFPVKFQLLKHGKLIKEVEDQYEFECDINGDPGNYRLVANIWLDEQWVPWVYTNPIYVY